MTIEAVATGLSDGSLLREAAYVGGRWVGAADGATYPITDPATGSVIGNVPDMSAADAEAAVLAANDAFPAWAALTAGQRGAMLMAWHRLMIENADDLGRLMTLEQGKPLTESIGEIRYGASFVEWFAEEGKRAYGQVIPTYQAGKRLVVLKQAIGVAAAITPWNFPNAMITRKAAPALAAGCTFVVKPAGETPLSALAIAELADRAGIPPGVFNVITTSRSRPVGEVLTTHPLVRKFSFTGSTEVGRVLLAQTAATIKNVSMELGGNAPFIVFDDADIAAAVDGAIVSKYRNGGQTCVCANRLFVQEGVYDEFATRLAEATAKLRVGSGLESGVEIGPLINLAAVEKVERLVSDAIGAGGTAITGGSRHALGGSYFEPTVLTGVTLDMAIADEEIFGPVAPLFRFTSEEEAIAAANDTPYGLAAYFYSTDNARVWRVAEALEYGMVGANTGLISTTVAPFGGWKQSGIGREGSHEGLEEYLETKYLAIQID
jgi:succinate-semialdehyde dehydrogenase / glutarate-semialdehyde dehydrogenase